MRPGEDEDRPAEIGTMKVRMKIGCYAGEIRELRRDVALELLALGRVELPEAKAASAGAPRTDSKK